MNRKCGAILAWVLCAACVVIVIIQLILWTRYSPAHLSLSVLGDLIWNILLPLAYSILAALIIAHQPGNRVGWLMMIVGSSVTAGLVSIYLEHLPAPPQILTPGLWLLFWYYTWGWIPSIFPLFLIPLNFPTGKPPSARWSWVNRLAIGMWLFFILLAAFSKTFDPPLNSGWDPLTNPIGILASPSSNQPFLIIWFLGLFTLVSASIVSLVVRYRRAQGMERQQIKWLVFAGAFFALIYIIVLYLALVPTLNPSTPNDSVIEDWGNLLFSLSILSIPIAIAIAILRYRLYDIDILIRKTLVYSLLTGLLGLVFFGAITLLQSLFSSISKEQSAISIVLSTLTIAALFNPLRKRIQDFIDRRFYRQKYDAEQALAEFAEAARSETDLEQLCAHLTGTVQTTLQPGQVSLWLQEGHQ